jgi:hypothetical protein
MKSPWWRMLISVLFVAISFAGTTEKERALRYGADTKVVFRIVNEHGELVSNALVRAGFYLNEEKGNGIQEVTGTNGLLVAEKKSAGEINYWVRKEGCYETSGRFSFRRTGVANGRWQPYGMTNTVVLKRKVNPVAMYVKPESERIALPKQDEWVGFDLERADWTSPHGTGKREDFQVFFNLDAADEHWLSFKYVLTLRFPKPFDGFYRAKKDAGGSALRSVYEADTNRVYDSEITFISERRNDVERNKVNVTDQSLKEDEYLILRIRSETDKDGRLVKANYAKLYAPLFAARYGFLVTTYFNPKVNSPSLEADTTRNLRNPRHLNFEP